MWTFALHYWVPTITIVLVATGAVLVPRTKAWLWTNMDQLSKWVSTIALFVAAFWVYNVFIATQAPGLLRALAVSIEFDPRPHTEQDHCAFDTKVTVENFGSTVVDVAQIRLKIWRIAGEPTQAGNGFSLFDVTNLEQQKPLVDRIMVGALTGIYAPKAKFDHSYNWSYFPRVQPGETFIFSAVPEDEGGRALVPSADRWIASPCQR